MANNTLLVSLNGDKLEGVAAAGQAEGLAAYSKKWDSMHTARSDREWHITWGMLAPLAGPYLRAVPLITGSTDCTDVGCGVSDLGFELCRAHGLSTLWLLDASSVCIDQLQARYAAVADLSITARVADCRATPCEPASVRVVLDKGTLDAMESDADMHAMLAEMARILTPGGLIISVSFPAVKRLAFLDAALPPLALTHHTYVIASGDMSAAVVFLSLIFCAPAAGIMPPYTPDERTRRMLGRAAACGSLYEDEPDFQPPDPFSFVEETPDADV